MSALNSLPMQGQQVGRWATVTAALIITAAAAGTSLYLAARFLKADHEKTLCIRNAKLKYRELLAELSECKGLIDYIDKDSIPRAQEQTKRAHGLIYQYKESDGVDKDTLNEVKLIERELLGLSELLLRLMERIDGVVPAHVLDAAKLEPWTELDPKLKSEAINKGLGTVLDLSGDIRAIRKSLIQKAERRAKSVDALKSEINI